MANGDCPVGAALQERVAGMARDVGKLEECALRHEAQIEHNTRSIDKLVWQVSLGAAIGAAVLAPIVRWIMDVLLPTTAGG